MRGCLGKPAFISELDQNTLFLFRAIVGEDRLRLNLKWVLLPINMVFGLVEGAPLNFPASNVQQQMWLLNRMFPDNPAYNIPSLFRIKGSFNLPAMEASIRNLVARHEIFRTTFQDISRVGGKTRMRFFRTEYQIIFP